MKIHMASPVEAKTLAQIIARANRSVARQFALDQDNAPAHPSFCTADWIRDGQNRGETYFILEAKGKDVGCVAYESPEPDVAYLNRLAVLPEFQGQGMGKKLVDHIIDQAKKDQKKTISIGIIKAHLELAAWYGALGFERTGTKEFDHLPFNVQFMAYTIPPEGSR